MVHVPDAVSQETAVAAPPERVWKLLTDPDALAAWYAFGGAAIAPRPGGALEFRWDEHGAFRGRVEAAEPPRRLAFRFACLAPDRDPAPGNATLVTIDVVPADAGSRVRVTESGFAALDAPRDERAALAAASAEAWAAGLGLLRGLAQTGPK